MLQVREYKADLAKLQESSKAAAGSVAGGGASARAELGLSDDYSQTSAGQRDRLLQTTDKMSKTGERITQGRQQLLETEVCPALSREPGSSTLAILALVIGCLLATESVISFLCTQACYCLYLGV